VKTRLIVGVGSGRCGTHSLARLLYLQENTVSTHERYNEMIRWNCPKNLWPLRLWRDTKAKGPLVRADISLSWTPHIGTFLDWAEQEDRFLRIVGMKRDRDEVVNSYIDAKLEDTNHWTYPPKKPDEKTHPWDEAYPSCVKTHDKRRGIELFWEKVYNIIEHYAEKDNRVKVFNIDALNSEKGVSSILDFCGYESKNVKTSIKIRNTNKDSEMFSKV